MKQIYTWLLLILFQTTNLSAQCYQPISFRDFSYLRNQLLQPMPPARQYQMAMDMASKNCFLAAQVEDLAAALTNDRDRLDFCKLAYTRTVDKENFDDVYDAFTSFSNALRLYKYVNQNSKPIVYNPTPAPNPLPYNYPNMQQYRGRYGCNTYVNDFTFKQLKQQILSSGSEPIMFNTAKSIIGQYCLTVSQMIDIAALFNNEAFRFDLIQAANNNLYDPDNGTYFDQMFTTQPYRDKCHRLFGNPPVYQNQNQPPVQRCEVSQQDFLNIKSSIEKISFNSSRESQLKSIARGRCFSVNQIKELLKLYSFESSKLDLAKFLYEFCIDKQNYFQVNDVFSFSSSVDDLNKFLQSK